MGAASRLAAVLVLVGALVAGVVMALARGGPGYEGRRQPGVPVAWVESAQPMDWDALWEEASPRRSGGADGGGAGGAQGSAGEGRQTQPDSVPQAPPLVLPRADWPSYRWHAGDQTLEVFLDRSVEMVPDGGGFRFGDRASRAGGVSSAGSGGYPAFRSSAGELMALPGGVILMLDPGWGAAAVEEFLARNGIGSVERTVLDFVTNGFVIATAPGFASLDLANRLAAQDGVEISSPNWLIEMAPH